ncbi:MAG: ATP phosphoribosyltransferase regulatory subunit [bacterium]|nr:ATP phosphoribosyltransferase regulatory subunit [bacterium]
MSHLTPFGVRDYLPHEITARQAVLRGVSKVFKAAGFERVVTPTFEYYEALLPGMGAHLRKKAIRFNGVEGNDLVLRPDHTAAIARVVGSRLTAADLPVNYYYLDPIFRRSNSGEDIEQFQAGIEMIGDASVDADAKVIGTAIEAMRSLGFDDVKIDIGYAGYVASLSETEQKALRYGDYTAGIPAHGGVEVVQDVPELVSLHAALTANGYADYVTYNKGLVRDFSYYTGVMFDVVVPGCGRVLGSGGRYDELMGQFGFSAPAVGFALRVNRLQELMDV